MEGLTKVENSQHSNQKGGWVMKKVVYLNWKGKYGLETIDEFSPEPGQTWKDFNKYLSKMISEYSLCGMSVYRSSRACKNWK